MCSFKYPFQGGQLLTVESGPVTPLFLLGFAVFGILLSVIIVWTWRKKKRVCYFCVLEGFFLTSFLFSGGQSVVHKSLLVHHLWTCRDTLGKMLIHIHSVLIHERWERQIISKVVRRARVPNRGWARVPNSGCPVSKQGVCKSPKQGVSKSPKQGVSGVQTGGVQESQTGGEQESQTGGVRCPNRGCARVPNRGWARVPNRGCPLMGVHSCTPCTEETEEKMGDNRSMKEKECYGEHEINYNFKQIHKSTKKQCQSGVWVPSVSVTPALT